MDSKTIRRTLGELQDDPDRAEAWQALREAAQVSEGDLSVSDALRIFAKARRAHEDRGEYDAVANLLSLEVTLASNTPDETALVVEQARVLQDHLYDEEGALVAYLRVLELAPDEPNASTAIGESEDKRGRWKELTATYLDEASGAPDHVYKSSMLMRAAEMELRFAGEEMNEERVAGRLREAMELDPSNDRAAKILEVLYRRAERWSDVASVLERVSSRSEDAANRVRTGIRLARVRRIHLRDLDAAAVAYERVLKEQPGHSGALHFLSEYYSRAERWDDLVGIYEKSLGNVNLSNPEHLGEILQIAMLHWKKRENPTDAEPWFEHIRKINPAFPGMLDFFRDYSRQTGDQGRLLGVLQGAQRALPEGEDKRNITTEIARLAEDQKDAQRAIEQYKSVLRQDPDNRDARERLKDLYRKTQGYNALVELLRQELERTDSSNVEARLVILREVASVYRQFIKSDTALVSVLNQIVQLKDDDVDAIRELIGLYEKLQRWRDLLANQQRLAELIDDPTEKADLYRRVGRSWLDQFSNVQNATQAFESLLAIVPGDEEAIERLQDLYKKRRAWPALYELYQTQLSSLEGGARVRIMKEMAELASERLRKGNEAAKLYRDILEIDPSNIDVLDAMEKNAERAKDWPTLAEALERRVEVLKDEAARLAVLQKLGTVYADHIGDHQGAVRAWRRVLELQPGHHRALRVLRDSYLLAGDYDGLEELFASQNDWEGLADVLSNTADRAKDEKVKIELSYRAAAVYTDKLNQSDRAFRSYERILAVDPADTRAARGLIPLYEADDKWARLTPLYELIVQKSGDQDEQLAFLKRLIDVSADRLNDRAAAAKYGRRAYELAPDDESTLAVYEAATRAAGTWDDFVEALEARAKKIKKKKRRALELKLAQTYAVELGKTDEAVAIYKRLVEADPADDEAGGALESILRGEARRDDLRWLLGLRTENAATDHERVRLLTQWAELEESAFDSPGEAALLYQKILDIDPADEGALRSLARLLLAAGDVSGAVTIIERHRDLAADSTRAELEAQLAELYLGSLDRKKDALQAAVRTLSLSEHDSRAVSVLQRLLAHPETKERAAEVLAAEYAAMGDARQEADALTAMLQAAKDRGERLALYGKLADVQEHKLESANAALDVILRAVREAPAELTLWERAEALATRAGRPTDLSDAFREALGAELPPAVEVELCERAARLHEERLGDPVAASPYLERVLSHEPGNSGAFARLKQILTGAERWGELEELYARTSEATEDPVTRAEMLAEVALVCEEIIEDHKKATHYYEQILEIDPSHETAMNALDRLYEQQERYRDLANLLERRLSSAVGDETLDMKRRLARIQLERLHEPGRAVDHCEDILRERPNDYEARELAEKLLEIGDLKIRAARMLESVYETRGEVRELVRVLEIRLSGVDAQGEDAGPAALDERRELLRRIANLRDERLHDDQGAFDALARYVPLDPVDEESRARLLDIGGRLGAMERVAEVLTRAGERAETPGLTGEILMIVARLYEDQLGDSARAESTYRKALAIDPEDAQLALPAARALERVYVQQNEHGKLAEMLRTQIRLEQDPAARMELLGRLGNLCETVLDDPNGAIEAWTTRLEESPADRDALAALDRLYERTERWRELCDVLERREEGTTDSAARRELLRRQADVLAKKLSAPTEAIDVWRAIADEFGPDTEVLRALERLYAEAERWDDLAETYERHLDVVDDHTERLDLLFKLGDLRRLRLGNTPGALEMYRQALTLDAAHRESRSALETLLESEDTLTRREAAEILHPIYESDADNEKLLRVLEVEIAAADDPIDKLEGLEKAIRVADSHLSDPRRAYGYVRQAVRQAAGHTDLGPWLAELDRLAEATDGRADQVALLRDVVRDIFDGDVQFSVTLKIAALARDQLKDAGLAQTYYKNALEQRPDDRQAMVALEALYAEADDVTSLLSILERRVDVAESESEKKELLFRRARLLTDQVDDKARAIEVYEIIADLDMDPEAVGALEKLYSAEARWDDLIELYQRELEVPGAAKADLHVKVARVASERLGDPIRAFDEIETALEIDRHHEGAIAELERVLGAESEPENRARAAALLEPIYLVRADYDRVMSTIQARLESSEDATLRRELLTRLAHLYEEQKEDYTAALETVARLLHEDLADESTTAELERLAKVAGAERRLAEIYAAELAEVTTDDDSSATLAKRTGEIFSSLGENEKALEFYRRALAFDPDSGELFDAVASLLERTQKHEERVALYKSGLDYKFEPDQRLAYLHTIAELQQNELSRPDEAIETYRAALEVDERDARALDALTGLYRKRERWEDLAELTLRRAESAESPEKGAAHRLVLARLYKNELSDTDHAIDQLEEIVRAVPTHDEAIAELEALKDDEARRERIVEILRPLYEGADDWRRVIKLNEDRFELADLPAEKVAVLRETAELWETRGGDNDRARRALAVSLDIDPEDADVRADYERLTEATGAWDELAELYETILSSHPDLLSKHDVLEKLAEVHDQRRNDPRRALEAYDKLRALDEADLETIEKMEQLATLLSDWDVLVRVLTSKAELVPGDEDRASIWRQVGEARRDMLENRAGAIEAYERAAELDPESTFTLDCLIDLLESSGDPERLVELYQQRVELASEDDADLKYELLVKASETFEKRLEDRLRAIDCLNQALGVKPADGAVLASLNRLYRAEKMWPELLDNLKLEASAAAEPATRTALRRQIAEILAEQLESYDEALEAYRLVLDEAPDDAGARRAIRRIGDQHEDLRSAVAEILVPVLRLTESYDELCDVLELRLTTETDPSERANTLRTIAETLETRLSRPADALGALLRAVSEQPEAHDIHADIERLAGTCDGWPRYADALSERAQSTFDVDLAKELYSRLGRIAEEHLKDERRAVEAYSRAVEQAGDQPELLEALDRLYGRIGDSRALSEILERRIAVVSSDREEAELHYRIAVIHVTEFREPSRGLTALRAALEKDPAHEGATEELEGLTEERDLFDEAAEILEEVYRSRGQNDRLASLYEKKVGFAESPHERIDMRRSLARVLEEDVRDPAAAQRVLQQGFADDPSDEGLLEEIERLAPITQNWEGAAAALRDAIDEKPELLPDVARDLCVRVAVWYRDRVGDREAAEKAYLKALDHDPRSDEVLVQLEELQSASGRERDLVATLRRRAKLALGDDQREEIFRRAKQLADSIGDAALGEAVLRELLAADDANAWALAELSALREGAGDYKEMFTLLLRRIEIGAHDGQARELKHRAASIARTELDDSARAIELYEELFEEEPTDTSASTALRELYVAAGREDELARLLERLIDVADAPSERSALRLELARLKRDRENALDDAIDILRTLLEDDPSNADAVVELSELYEAGKRHEDLADLLKEQTAAARDRGDAEAELRFQVRLGDVYDKELGDPAKATETYRAVLDREPNHRGALEALARLYQTGDDHQQAAQVLERLVALSEGEEALRLSMALADEYGVLDDKVRAATALERGLAVDPRNEAIRTRLRSLYELGEDWEKLAEIIAVDADAALETDEKVRLLRQAATIHSERRKDSGAAAELLQKASELRPDDRDLMLELCDAYSASGRGKEAVQVLEQIVESYGGKRSKELGEIHRRLARAYLADGATERGLEELDKAFRIEPGNVHVLKELGLASLDVGDLKRAQQMFRALLLQKLDDKGPISKAEVFMYLGDVHHRMGEKQKAIQMLERALQTDPGLAQAQALLDQVKA